MKPTRIARVAVIFPLLLAACSDAPAWTKAGASPEAARADLRDCQREANAAVARDANIDTDILASRGNDWRNTNTLGAKKETFAIQNRGYREDIINRCMAAKGYAPAT